MLWTSTVHMWLSRVKNALAFDYKLQPYERYWTKELERSRDVHVQVHTCPTIHEWTVRHEHASHQMSWSNWYIIGFCFILGIKELYGFRRCKPLLHPVSWYATHSSRGLNPGFRVLFAGTQSSISLQLVAATQARRLLIVRRSCLRSREQRTTYVPLRGCVSHSEWIIVHTQGAAIAVYMVLGYEYRLWLNKASVNRMITPCFPLTGTDEDDLAYWGFLSHIGCTNTYVQYNGQTCSL